MHEMKPPQIVSYASAWRQLSVLIIGCGSAGRRHARVFQALGLTDLRIVDPISARRSALEQEVQIQASFTSLAEALSNPPDVAIVCTPPALHIEHSVAALEAGAHVLCEKPLAESLAEALALRCVIEQSGRIFAVGFCMRHHQALRAAKARLDEGAIGRLVSVRCRMGEHLPTVRPDYQDLFTREHMGVFDLTHEIDLACWFADRPIARVAGFCGAFSDLGFKAPDIAELLIEFNHNCIASVHLDYFSSARLRSTELIGTEGVMMVEYSHWENAELAWHPLGDSDWKRQQYQTRRDDMFMDQNRLFLEAITTGSAPGCNFDSSLQSLAVIGQVWPAPAVSASD